MRSGSDEDQAFVQNLALFLTAFFRAHAPALEATEELRAALLAGLDTLVSISYVDDDEVGSSPALFLFFHAFFV